MEYRTVMLAGLLHDMGKLLQKGSFGSLDVRGKHPEVSARFIRAFKDTFAKACDVALLETLAMKHHEHPDFPPDLRVESAPEEAAALALLVSRADNYSSSERGKAAGGYRDYKTRPLESVFCRLEIGKKLPELKAYHAGAYSVGSLFPEQVPANSENDLNSLLQAFGREFAALAEKKPAFEGLYTGLYTLLFKYAWCIPSNSQEEVADVSLFDHLKTTSAIASCLYLYHQEKGTLNPAALKDDRAEKFILAVGDISGIQNYIFSGISIGAGGMARKLRARSFMINMLSELAALNLVEAVDLPVASIIMSSGGKFYVLLPNTEKAQQALKELQVESDRSLLEAYQGELAFNLANRTFCGRDFSAFGKVTERVNRALVLKKQQPFADLLQASGVWQVERFIFDEHDRTGLGPCRGCGREFAMKTVESIPYGARCLREMELGRRIPRTAYLQLTAGSPELTLTGSRGFRLAASPEELSPVENETVFVLNDSCTPPGAVLLKEAANYVPHENDRVLTFEEIAARSRGMKRLGLLKADVDNLGKLFAFGLKREEGSLDSISRVTTLSRMLDHFFSGQVNRMLQVDYPHCYTVYSGGDDLVIIGPWDKVVALAGDLQTRFTNFVAGNPNITLSAGISFFKPRTPVIKAVDAAEALLERSKETASQAGQESRNQVSLFGKTMTWPGFAAMTAEGERLANWALEKKVSSSMLYSLKQYDLMYQKYQENQDVEGLRYKAFLAYQIGRMKKERRTDSQVLRWHEDLLGASDARLENLGAAVDYAFSIIREGDANE